MSRFKSILDWLGLSPQNAEVIEWFARQPTPKITYAKITDVNLPPANNTLQSGIFYRVLRNRRPKWALFLCPCGCGSVITLSLQLAHKPHWKVAKSDGKRPTMWPSVWRDVGCLSHFWIEDGRVYWCGNSGSQP